MISSTNYHESSTVEDEIENIYKFMKQEITRN